MRSIVEILIINTILRTTHTASLHSEASESTKTYNMLRYLSKFGYLPSPSSGKLPLITQDGLVKSLRKLQSFVGLEMTGVIDEETLEILKIPRCSLPDFSDDNEAPGYNNQRRKRYALQGSRWKKRILTYKVGKYPSKLSRAEVDADVGKAFKMWAKASGLTFSRKYSGSVDIEIRFEDYYHGDEDSFDGPGGTEIIVISVLSVSLQGLWPTPSSRSLAETLISTTRRTGLSTNTA